MRLTKKVFAALPLVFALMTPSAFWGSAGLAQKPAHCLGFGECELVTCNQNGTYTYTFQVTNQSAFAATEAKFGLANPATAVITPNPYPLNPPLPPGQSRQITVTLGGVGPNTGLCFALSVHDEQNLNCCSEVNKCVKLPSCAGGGPQPAACARGGCCSQAPRYGHTTFNGQKVAAVTGWSQTAADPALTVFDLSGAGAFALNANNTPPKFFGHTGNQWTMSKLGSVFGVTIDHQGNIYVTASSAYNTDSYPQGPGRIFKIANGTGVVSNFNAVALPNSQDPALVAAGVAPAQAYPALGNISFDCAHKQFFVTNEEDGRIYRLDFSGSVVSTFDHATGVITNSGGLEAGDAPGFAPLGERLWAVKEHNGRVYYSVWNEDCSHPNPAVKNEIWSVGLNAVTGDFTPNDKRMETSVPDIAGTNFSNPTSDISFSPAGTMLLAERTMGCNFAASACAATSALSATQPNAHASRVLEFECTDPGWKLTPQFVGSSYKYNVGLGASSGCTITAAGHPANAAGGVDYDYDAAAAFGMWATGDYLKNSPFVYGLQGFPLGGGTVSQSPLVALYGPGSFKMQIGDVAVSCPPGVAAY